MGTDTMRSFHPRSTIQRQHHHHHHHQTNRRCIDHGCCRNVRTTIRRPLVQWLLLIAAIVQVSVVTKISVRAEARMDDEQEQPLAVQQSVHQPAVQQQQQQPVRKCERLKTSLTYSQEDAPSDLSGVLPVIVERINRELEGVIDVEVEWMGTGFLQHHHHGGSHPNAMITGGGGAQVGEHIIQCTVSRLASSVSRYAGDDDNEITTTVSGDIATQCYHIPFTITDTNECLLPPGHVMYHQCDESTICVNTIGSYECVCPTIRKKSKLRLEQGETITDPNRWKEIQNIQERGPWELSYKLPGQSSCPFLPSTYQCCPSVERNTNGGGDGGETTSCRGSFKCPIDPCSKSYFNDCSAAATCQRNNAPTRRIAIPTTSTAMMSGPKDYTCSCPKGYMGNGHVCRPNDPKPIPKVMYDGVTPTELTLKHNLYCDCTIPLVDICAGYPPCEGKHQECVVDTNTNGPTCGCKKGYVYHDTYGCVDEVPPVLRLKHDPNNDQTLHLKQGDTYTEYAVDIYDENAEEYLRSLKIAYSKPIPPKCFTRMGEFHVNYTIATPWTVPPYLRIMRRVIINDINECTLDVQKYTAICPELVPKCDASATCINTIGSYKCQCPQYTSGDGFEKGLQFTDPAIIPEGYQGGQGCIDTTPPAIQIQGPNPKIFRVAECSGIAGIMNSNSNNRKGRSKTSNDDAVVLSNKYDNNEDKIDLKQAQQQYYGDDIKKLIKETAGAELCATYMNTNPNPSDCVYAYDMTAKGRIDLSKKVVVGDPIQKSTFRWSVPYNVKDEAGNTAETVWRDIIIEEINLRDIENKIRTEVLAQQKMETEKAIEKAVREERNKRKDANANDGGDAAAAATVGNKRNRRNANQAEATCPACPKCSNDSTETTACSVETANEVACEMICRAQMESCAIDEHSYVFRFMHALEKSYSATTITFLYCSMVAITILLIRLVYTWIFNPIGYIYSNGWSRYSNRQYDGDDEEDEQKRRLLQSVAYYNVNDDNNSNGMNGTARSNGSTRESFWNAASSTVGGDGGYVAPPRASMSLGTDREFFTPTGNGSSRQDAASRSSSSSLFGSRHVDEQMNDGGTIPQHPRHSVANNHNDFDDIYEAPTIIITPSKRGDGVARVPRSSPHTSSASPFSNNR